MSIAIITHAGTTYRLQHDLSGVGHCWRDCDHDIVGTDDDPTSDYGQCAAALIEDGDREIRVDDREYRWVEADIEYHLATETRHTAEEMVPAVRDRSIYSADSIAALAAAAEDPEVQDRLAQSLVALGIWRIIGDDAALLATGHYDAAEDYEDDDHEAASMAICIGTIVNEARHA